MARAGLNGVRRRQRRRRILFSIENNNPCFKQSMNGKYHESIFDHLGRRTGLFVIVSDGGGASSI